MQNQVEAVTLSKQYPRSNQHARIDFLKLNIQIGIRSGILATLLPACSAWAAEILVLFYR
jgi:hypothetical protein